MMVVKPEVYRAVKEFKFARLYGWSGVSRCPWNSIWDRWCK